MNPFEMVLGIIIVISIAKVLQSRYRGGRDWRGQPVEQVATADSVRLREEIRSLRERIQVLERVITDNHSSSSLDREIERLRDENRV